MVSHTVCAVTGSRAEFGLLRPLLVRLSERDEIDLRVVVTGSHLSGTFGGTQKEITDSGLAIHKKIPLPLEGDSKHDMAKAAGAAVSAFADYFSSYTPELLVVLGDRYEIFAAAVAAALIGVPIAHICGGELTEGAVDDCLRHSISKMSILHFTECEIYRQRVIQLGEEPGRVFNVGALGVENALHIPLMTLEELQKDICFQLEGRPFCVVTFHPVTMESGTAEAQMGELISAMEQFPEMNYLITLSNADAGGRTVNQIWEREELSHKNWAVVPSLGTRRYLSALRYARLMLGNSSSGIIEGPISRIPTVNIGDRQKGRIMAESVLCCPPVCEAITVTMERALSPEFQQIAKGVVNPFGDGRASEQIMSVICAFLTTSGEHKKTFYDVSFKSGEF